MFKGYRLGSGLTKNITIEFLQSPMDLYYRQGLLRFLLKQTQAIASDHFFGTNGAARGESNMLLLSRTTDGASTLAGGLQYFNESTPVLQRKYSSPLG